MFVYSSDKDVLCVDDEEKPRGTWMRAKLIQFHTNYRPAYYGTWRKQSKLIRPRKPLNQDKVQLAFNVQLYVFSQL